MNSMLQQLVNALNSNKTNMDECLSKADSIIETISNNIKAVGASSTIYIKNYDNYLYNNVIDADLLKEKLKDNLVKVIDDEI